MDEAVRHYRERYSTIGKFENSLIDGIPEMLSIFVARGYFLSVATSKLKTYAGDIIDHFDLRRYFQVLHGSELDGRNAAKGDLVRHILATERIEAGNAVMIGDRLHDMVGAGSNSVPPSACCGAMATGRNSCKPERRGSPGGRRNCPASSIRSCSRPDSLPEPGTRTGEHRACTGLGTSRRGTRFLRSRVIHSAQPPSPLKQTVLSYPWRTTDFHATR